MTSDRPSNPEPDPALAGFPPPQPYAAPYAPPRQPAIAPPPAYGPAGPLPPPDGVPPAYAMPMPPISVVPAPVSALPTEPVPYHQMLRGPRFRWWKPIVTLLLAWPSASRC